MLGLDHASARLNLADKSFSLPFEEAASFLKSRVPITKPEWKALEPKLRFRAFTVAALSTPDAIERVKGLALAAIEQGKSLAEFWTTAAAENAAGLGSSPWYWETVYRTNVQTSYNAGRAIEFTRNQPDYIEFVGIDDVRQTEICRSRSGVILPASHPFWKKNWPPLHFGCRSTTRAIYREEADALRSENPSWQPTQDKSLTGDVRAAAGFGGNPVETGSFYRLTPSMLERAKAYGLEAEIDALGRKLGLRYAPIELSRLASTTRSVAVKKVIPPSKADRAAIRTEAKATLKAQRGKTFDNSALGEPIMLDKAGIDHAASFSGEPSKLAILDHIPEILRSASKFETLPLKRPDPDFSEILRGRSALEVNGQRHLFAVVLKRRKSDGVLVFYEVLPWTAK